VVTGEQLSPAGFEYARFRDFMTREALAPLACALDVVFVWGRGRRAEQGRERASCSSAQNLCRAPAARRCHSRYHRSRHTLRLVGRHREKTRGDMKPTNHQASSE
jgi:hypothetical protein